QIGIAEHFADRRRYAVPQKHAARPWVGAEFRRGIAPVPMNDFSDRKSFFGMVNGRPEQIRPAQTAELLVQLVPTRHAARRGHRVDTLLRHAVVTLGLQYVES